MDSRVRIPLLYALFALLAIGGNLGVQNVVFVFLRSDFTLIIALVLGTGFGLVIKYALDKRFIFSQSGFSLKEDTKKFSLYSLMGVVTTMIFWGFEAGFDLLIPFDFAKYLGGFLGLSVGYTIKYHLDKRFVFKIDPASKPSPDFQQGRGS